MPAKATVAATIAALLLGCEGGESPRRHSGVAVERARPARPHQPIDAERLLVPDRVAGFELVELYRDRHPLYGSTLTSLTALYSRTIEDKERRLTLVILDGAFEPEAYRSFDVARATVLDGPAISYVQSTIAGEPAVALISRSPLTVQIHVLIADRVLIQAHVEGVEPALVREFVEALPIQALRALAHETA